MTYFVYALVIFLATHLIPGIRPLRSFLVSRLGKPLYLTLFSIASVIGLGFVGWTYSAVPYLAVWLLPVEARWFVVGAMMVSCFFVVTGVTTANPFSLGLGAGTFDPEKPGIVRVTKHPVVWGLFIWSAAHLMANGDMASLILFGLFSLLSALGPWVFNKRAKELMGAQEWERAAAACQQIPIVRALTQIGLFRLVIAVAVYSFLLVAHGPVIGVSPLDGL